LMKGGKGGGGVRERRFGGLCVCCRHAGWLAGLSAGAGLGRGRHAGVLFSLVYRGYSKVRRLNWARKSLLPSGASS
jgi:hypothetical protein